MVGRFFYLLPAVMSLMTIAVPVSAHVSSDHKMGVVDGLLHLITQPAHVLLLLLALAVLILGISLRKWHRQ
jgi:hypothetical protein